MSKTILLADDSVTIQKVVELTFMDGDYSVEAVSDGDAALEAFERSKPDFVIADVHMPGADGYEVCRRVKEVRPDVPVLLLVGTFEPFDEEEIEACGADGNLKKPFDSQELLRLVEGLSAVRERQRESRGVGADEELSWSDVEWGEEETATPSPAPLAGPAGEEGRDVGAEEAEAVPEEEAADELPGELEEPAEELEEPAEEVVEAAPRGFGWTGGAPPAAAAEEGGAEDVDLGSMPELEQLSTAPALDVEEPGAGEPAAEERGTEEEVTAGPPPRPLPESPTAPSPGGPLGEDDVDRVARRVVELLSEDVLRDVAWEVVPDLAEVVVKERIRELERQAEDLDR